MPLILGRAEGEVIHVQIPPSTETRFMQVKYHDRRTDGYIKLAFDAPYEIGVTRENARVTGPKEKAQAQSHSESQR